MLNKYTKQEIVRKFKENTDGNVHILELKDGFEFCDKKLKNHVIQLKVYNDKYYVTEMREDANVILGKYSVEDFINDLDNIMYGIVEHMEKLRSV